MIRKLYDFLFNRYGAQHWWPCRTGRRWEIIVGAILTQNCAWRNVEQALYQLEQARLDTPETILSTAPELLEQAIRPAGFFRQKSLYLREAAAFFPNCEAELLAPSTPEDLRRKRELLLSRRGIGRETADSILLYAFNQPIFVIDAYTRRIAARHLGWDAALPYDELQARFTRELPRDARIFNEYHALLVRHCKESCRKSACGDACRDWDHNR